MKVRSTVPFEFRGNVKLEKGESDFDPDALNEDARAFFDGLVKAEIVFLLDEPAAPAPRKPRAPKAAPAPSPEIPPPPPSEPPPAEGEGVPASPDAGETETKEA